LSALPGSFVAEALLFEWLEFLVLRAGHDSATAALTYYERIGWLGAEAAAALDTYLSGLNEAGVDGDGELDADDHRMSLHYVARLAALRG
jgi:archaellum component FlaD/FlaE